MRPGQMVVGTSGSAQSGGARGGRAVRGAGAAAAAAGVRSVGARQPREAASFGQTWRAPVCQGIGGGDSSEDLALPSEQTQQQRTSVRWGAMCLVKLDNSEG